MATEIEFKGDDIVRIAAAQKGLRRASLLVLIANALLWTLLLTPLSERLGIKFTWIIFVAVVPLFIAQALIAGSCAFLSARSLKIEEVMAWLAAVLAGLLTWPPLFFMSLLVMWWLLAEGTKILRKAGLKAGLTGVSEQDLDSWQAANKEFSMSFSSTRYKR
ncbi:MAG: hypothetical protein ABSE73_13070 [Planctomycetota bacterium]